MKFKEEIAEYLHFLRKKWNYTRDLLNPKQLEELTSIQEELVSLRIERGQSEGELKRLELVRKRVAKLFPDNMKVNGWVENVEVFFVAIILALAIRTYLYQPFKIPTDSMKPTLWGIAMQSHPEPMPNIAHRIFDLAAYGKSYHEIIAKTSGQIQSIEEGRLFGFIPITVTNIVIGELTHTVACSRMELFKGAPELLQGGRMIKEGEVLGRFERITGDQIFVNRWSYHFRLPQQGEVFVFTTHNIKNILDGHAYGSEQYYIKRCVGVPGVTLQIDPPYLLSNGEILGKDNLVFARNYAQKDGYSGYVFLPMSRYLTGLGEQSKLPDDQFWAMGDNSPQSSDSHVWGFVPRENLIGTGSFVYWPFGKRWGIIR